VIALDGAFSSKLSSSLVFRALDGAYEDDEAIYDSHGLGGPPDIVLNEEDASSTA
jgi:uridine phosphorylase